MPTQPDDPVLDLSFAPSWARQPAGLKVATSGRAGGKPPSREGRERPPRERERPPRAAAGAPFARPPRESRRAAVAPQERPAAPVCPVPLTIAFLPERRGLKPIADWIAKNRRAYSLMEIASLFLSKPEYYAVKVETATATAAAVPVAAPPPAPPSGTLFQCAECAAVFFARAAVVEHALARHLDRFYEKEDSVGEPPKGQFACVARCGLSGEWLGPPNYHGYNDRLQELHRTRYAHLTLEDYRRRIVNVADPAAIEQWKQQAARQTLYRARQADPPATFARWPDVEAHFMAAHAPGVVREGRRFILSGTVSRALEEPALQRAIQDAWQRETRFPLPLAVALQPAFRRLGLHFFKTPDRKTFVSAVAPRAINPAGATELVRRLLDGIAQQPGGGRQELVTRLCPGQPADAPAVGEVLSQLRWLIEEGHAIEFSDGKLAVPGQHPR